MSTTVQSMGEGEYCFTLNVNTPDNCNSYCCNQADLRKIEFNVKPECITYNAKVNATVNGVPTKVGAAFDSPKTGPPGSAVLRLTQLGLNRTSNGTVICITLLPNRVGKGCLSLQDLCQPLAGAPPGVCATALFDSKYDCCPISSSSEDAPPPPVVPLLTPPPPAGPCTSCFSLEVEAIGPVLFPLSPIPPEGCAASAEVIISEVTAQAEAVGAVLLDIPPVVTCGDLKVEVCFKFASDEDGAKLKPVVDGVLNMWFSMFLNTCKPYLRYPYQPFGRVGGPNGTSSCLEAYTSVSCDPLPIDFPKCECDTAPGATPFYGSPFLETRPGRTNKTTLYCFAVGVFEPYDSTSACGQTTTLLKAEIFADDAMRNKVKAIGLQPAGQANMTFQATSWGTIGEQTLKATPLNWSFEQADGASICMEVDANADIGDLCMNHGENCSINFFSIDKKCCPVFTAGTD